MTYLVALIKSDEGYSVSVPALPGCQSQGRNESEAIENIRSAIEDYLSVDDELPPRPEVRFIEVTV
jgi:predicted RNase H-like HicB family nuclease